MRYGVGRLGWRIRCCRTGHWAAATNDELAQYPHDAARAQRLLEEAGFPAGKDGVRMRLTMKTSTDETTRLMAAVLQQQLRAAGIRAGDSLGGVWDVLCGRDQGRVSDLCAALDWK